MAKNGSMAEALVYLKNVKYSGGVLLNQQYWIRKDAYMFLMYLE
jgi:hypothetical protein